MVIDAFFAWLHAVDQWLDGLLQLIIFWVQNLGPIGVFAGVMIETLIAPIPSPVIMMAAGFLLTQGHPLHIQLLIIAVDVMLVGAIASTIGSFFGYGIAYAGGYPVIERYGKYLGTSIEEVEYMRQRFEKSSRDEVFLFVARAVPIIPLSVVSIVAGAIRMDWKHFAIVTFLGTLPRCLVLGISGWLVGAAFSQLGEMVDFLETLTLLLLILFIVVFIIFRLILRRRAKSESEKSNDSGN
ncbi:MAG: DedA family protein [Promethearchaeota archaeon]